MPRRALIDNRPYLLLGLLFGITYFFVMDGKVGGSWLALWKGAGVAFLAMYALHRGSGHDGMLIALVMTVCALADVILEFSFLIGGILFAIAHCIALYLYAANRRARLSVSQIALAIALVAAPPAIAAMLSYPQANWWLATAYAALVGVMAAGAWTSRFPRYRTGLGAVFFVISDLVLVAREAGQLAPAVAEWIVWPTYFAGQFLIVTGVIQTIRGDLPSEN